MSAVIQGVEKVFDNISKANASIKSNAGAHIQYAGIECQALAKKLCPVGTPESTGKKGYAGGRLRASIHYVKTGPYSCKVVTNVNYALYVEMGTYKMKAQPYLHPAYVQAKAHLLAQLAQGGI